MQFPRSLLLALVSALAAYAQTATGPNAFTNVGLAATAGQEVTLTWTPTTGGTVDLVLRDGASNNLNAGTTIASGVENTGSYTWNVPESAVRGSDYTIEIIGTENGQQVSNYSPYFVLESTNTVVTTSASSATTSVAPLPTTISTASPTSSGMTTSMSGSSTGTSSGTMTTSGTSSGTSRPSSTTNSDLVASQSSSTMSGAGARATAMVGMLGAVALGAMAL